MTEDTPKYKNGRGVKPGDIAIGAWEDVAGVRHAASVIITRLRKHHDRNVAFIYTCKQDGPNRTGAVASEELIHIDDVFGPDAPNGMRED